MRFAIIALLVALCAVAPAQESGPPWIARSAAGEFSEDHLRAWMAIARHPQPRDFDRYLGGVAGNEALFEPGGRGKLCASVAGMCRDASLATAWGESWLAANPGRLDETERIAEVRVAVAAFADFRRSWQPPAAEIPEQQLRDAYAASPERWKRQDICTLRHLLLPRTAHVADADRAATVAAIRGRLAAGEKLEALAREFSAASSARNGGLMEGVAAGKIPAGLAEAVAATPEAEFGKVREADVDYAHFFYEVIECVPVPDVAFEHARAELETDAKGLLSQQLGEARIAELMDAAGIRVAAGCDAPDAVLLTTPDRTWTCGEFEAWTDGERGMARPASFARTFASGLAVLQSWDDDRAQAWRSVARSFAASRLAEADLRVGAAPDDAAVQAWFESHRNEPRFQTGILWRVARVAVAVDLDEQALKTAPRSVLGDYYHLRHGLDGEAARLRDALSAIPMAERPAFLDGYRPTAGYRVEFSATEPTARVPDEIAPLVDQLAAGEPTPVCPWGDSQRSILWWTERIESRALTFDEARDAARTACIGEMATEAVTRIREKLADGAPVEFHPAFFPDGPCPPQPDRRSTEASTMVGE